MTLGSWLLSSYQAERGPGALHRVVDVAHGYKKSTTTAMPLDSTSGILYVQEDVFVRLGICQHQHSYLVEDKISFQ